jgi:6-phosphogluconolactonase (cycloisomerase 2 family)
LDAVGLVLQNNGGPDLAVSTNGSFTFPAQLSSGSAYSVTIKTQPNIGPVQVCSLTNDSGTVANGAITNVAIACVSRVYKFLYVTSSSANELRGYAIDAANGGLTALPGPPMPTPPGPVSPTPEPSGKFLFLATRGDSFFVPPQMSVYRADNVTGALSEITGSPYLLDSTPGQGLNLPIFVHPSGAFGHVSLPGSPSRLYGATIDPTTGELTQIPGTPINVGFGMTGVTYDATGGFVFVPTNATTNGDGEIRSFLVNVPSGVLTPIGSFPTSGNGPFGAVLTPNGDYLLTTHINSATLMVFAVNKTAGTLTPITVPVPTGPAGARPFGIVYNRRNNVFYTTHVPPGPSSVATFRLDPATGAVSSVGTPQPTNGGGGSVQLHVSGRFLYQYNRNSAPPSIQRFSIDQGTGAPTLLPDVTMLPGAANVSMIQDASGRYLYVTDENASTVSSYSIDASTGALTLINTVPTSPSGLFTLPFLLQ